MGNRLADLRHLEQFADAGLDELDEARICDGARLALDRHRAHQLPNVVGRVGGTGGRKEGQCSDGGRRECPPHQNVCLTRTSIA